MTTQTAGAAKETTGKIIAPSTEAKAILMAGPFQAHKALIEEAGFKLINIEPVQEGNKMGYILQYGSKYVSTSTTLFGNGGDTLKQITEGLANLQRTVMTYKTDQNWGKHGGTSIMKQL